MLRKKDENPTEMFPVRSSWFCSFKNYCLWEFPCGAMETNLTRNHEAAGLIPGRTQWVKCRDLALL